MKVFYLWNFKPGETQTVPRTIIQNNQKYTDSYTIITKYDFDIFLKKENLFQEFPKLQNVISQIPKWIILTDLARLLLIYCYSGLYCDVDCILQKPLLFAKNPNKVYTFEEKVVPSTTWLGPREKKQNKYRRRIANYCFGTDVVRHAFFKKLIEECISRFEILLQEGGNPAQWTLHDIFWCCGPDVITTLYHDEKDQTIFHLYDQSYVKHLQYGSWKKY